MKNVVGKKNVDIMTTPTDDLRSYHISSALIEKDLGFKPQYSIESAVQGLVQAFRENKIQDPFDNLNYHNVKMMNAIRLS